MTDEGWVDYDEMIQCGVCFDPLRYGDAVGMVRDKGVGAGDTPATAPVHLLVCRRCSGIPEGLEKPA